MSSSKVPMQYYILEAGLTVEMQIGYPPSYDELVIYGLDSNGNPVHIVVSPEVWIEIADLCQKHFPQYADPPVDERPF